MQCHSVHVVNDITCDTLRTTRFSHKVYEGHFLQRLSV